MRTPAQNQAAERDGPHCLWHKYRLGALVSATDVHHLLGRGGDRDRPELCLSLCHRCHIAGNHAGREPTREQLKQLLFDLYGYSQLTLD